MDFEDRPADWLGYREAVERIVSAARPLRPAATVPVSEAVGLALAEDVVSPVTLPPWDNAAMDGYAVVGSDLAGAAPESPVQLRVVGEIFAGQRDRPSVRPGEAVRIMTGAPVPDGADSVVRVEDTVAGAANVVGVTSVRDVGRNIRPGGADLQTGQVALSAGSSIGAGAVAVLASVGRTRIAATRRPRVAVISSGDELVSPDQIDMVDAGWAIVDSNGPMLAAQVTAAGALPERTPVAADTVESVRARLLQAAASDLIITAGGASMGAGDLFKRVLDTMDYELDFWRARIRPGSPVSFGHLMVDGRRVPLLGLPGNPASAFVTFHLFARPLIRRMAGHGHVDSPIIDARCGATMTGAEHLTVFLRVQLSSQSEGPPLALPTGPQASGLVSGLPRADGLLVHPEGTATVEEGDLCQVLPLHMEWS